MNRSQVGHSIAAVLFALGLGHAVANPTGGQVASGSATITTIPGTVTVNQSSNIAIINWQSFSIGAGELTKFVQPSASSAVLNRVLGGSTSIIDGTLSANGQVLLINGNGVVVGPGGVVCANSFLGSSRDISDTDFLCGNLHFTGNNANGVQNKGSITALGGDVYLIGKTVDNTGTINAANGTAGLAAGDDVLLNLCGEEHVFVSNSPTASSATSLTGVHNSGTIAASTAELKAANGNLYALAINNEGTIRATTVCETGGRVFLTTDSGMVQNNGTISAKKGKNGGKINFTGGSVWNRATVDASGEQGGNVTVKSQNIQNDGSISVKGTKCYGGTVDFIYAGNALGSIKGNIDATGKLGGGYIDFTGTGLNSEAYLSLTLDVSSQCGKAGTIDIVSPTIYLTGATVKANGYSGGGNIFLGQGDPSVNPTAPHAQVNVISVGTLIQANALASGNGGTIDAIATQLSVFEGIASASGAGTGSAGTINISGPPPPTVTDPNPVILQLRGRTLVAKGVKYPSAATTTTGTGATVPAAFEFIDPNPGAGNAFGRPFTGLFNLATNRTLITAPGDSFGGAGAGAAYLFNNTTGALISTLRGNHAGDALGANVQVLTGGNFAIKDPGWNSGVGAIGFGNGTTGFFGGGGFVSATNSLIGAAAGDQIGSGGIFPLFNGNYLVLSPNFNNSAGAVTFVKPASGVVGVVAAANSLVGATAGDQIGSGGVIQLSNGQNYVVLSPDWGGGKGAVTNGNGMTGVFGAVSSTNSLVGANTGDHVGSGGSVFDTGLGYYLVSTLDYNGGAGAVTWSADGVGTTGEIDSTNSLVGTSSTDHVGNGGITILYDNHNYVVTSSDWNNGAGAVTLGSSSSGVSGVVGSTNSLVGAAAGDHAGSGGITALFGDARYVVSSPDWNNGAGAITLARDTTGATGVIGSTNSLVGANRGDAIGSGGITVLDNGNFLVLSPNFNSNAGAVTWEDVSTGQTGVVSSSNSLVGANSGDKIGSGGIVQLSNGQNYLVLSPDWSGGKGAITNGNSNSALTGVVGATTSLVGVSNSDHVGAVGSIKDSFGTYYLVTTTGYGGGAGAVTWNTNDGGTTGAISSANSLVGSSSSDHVGSGGITILFNGDYVVDSPDWSTQKGAVTHGDRAGGIAGVVSNANSLVGTTNGDRIGSGGILQLSNATNYLVLSSNWNGGRGAVTNLSASGNLSGAVSSSNSLVGSSTTDAVGSAGTVIDPFNGYYLVKTANWNGGMGAVTWNSDDGGVVGAISSANSLVGSSTSDHVGSAGVTILFNGNYVVNSPNWNSNAGAVSFGSATTGVKGTVGSANSLVGANSGDGIGSGGIRTLPNNNFLVLSPGYSGGAGAVTWVDGTSGLTGVASSTNSLVGATSSDALGSGGIQVLYNGNYLVLSPNFNGNAGAVTWGSQDAGVSGVVSSTNSLVGAASGDRIGSGGITQLSNGQNYVVLSPNWSGGKGAITNGSSSAALTGVVGETNSLVGANTGDALGSGNAIVDSGNGSYYLVRDVNFNGTAGSITWNSDNGGTVGVVSSTNSLVGAASGDALGSGGIATLNNDNYLVLSPGFGGGAGAVTWGSRLGGTVGVVSSTNSLVGADSSDHIGSGGLVYLSNGNYLVLSPLYNGSAGAVTWGSQATGVTGVVSGANSITGGGPDSGEHYAGMSADGSIYLISFTTDTSKGGDGRVVAGSVNGPGSTVEITSQPNYFVDPSVISVAASGFDFVASPNSYYIANPEAVALDPVSVDAVTGGAVNSGTGSNLASGSSTSNAPGVHRMVTPGNGIWNIFGGIVHSAPPPAFISQQLQINLSPEVFSHLNGILFGAGGPY